MKRVNLSINFNLESRTISPCVAINEEDALKLESIGGKVKRSVSEKLGSSCIVSLKFAPNFRRSEGCIAELAVGQSYQVQVFPYRFVYEGVEGVSMQAKMLPS